MTMKLNSMNSSFQPRILDNKRHRNRNRISQITTNCNVRHSPDPTLSQIKILNNPLRKIPLKIKFKNIS